MLVSLKTVTIFVFVVYCILTCYTGYILLRNNNNFKENIVSHRKWTFPDDGEDWNPWGEEFEREQSLRQLTIQKSPVRWWSNQSLDFGKQFYKTKLSTVVNEPFTTYNVEIWGKAAIGLYLWEHILSGKLESKMDGVWSYGFKKVDNFKFKFRTGPGVITTKAPADVQNLVLILNGRNEDKITFAKMWLDALIHFQNLKTVILIMLGNEQCRNDWLIPYMSKSGGPVNATFIVYDSTLIDNVNFYQWPLGVATYRGFPKVDSKKLDLDSVRPYVCNFLGTVYPHSSREKLIGIINRHNLSHHCFIKSRYEWQPKETKNSLAAYVQSLRLSDVTLNPVGMNTECYRIYEAMAYGSVPVVEDVMTSGACGNSRAMNATSPLRLLKLFNAPVIYIKDWMQLPELIAHELNMPLKEKIARRIKIVEWYENFKLILREKFLSVLKDKISQLQR